MSKYTTEVRFICEWIAGCNESQNTHSVDDIIDLAIPSVFDNFPIYDENHRKELCHKILAHYYTREIGEETYGLWRLRINTVLNEVMPTFNELYKANDIDFNPLYNRNVKTVSSTGSEGINKANDKGVNKFSDTPQNGLEDVETGKYLSSASVTESETNGSFNSNQQFNETRQGVDSTKSYAELLKTYRENMVNIDLEVVKSLSDCFMKVW